MTSYQQYQSGTWTECQGSVCNDDVWIDLAGYSFAGQVVNEDDFAEVVDKKEDPSAGTDANPEAEVTSFTVHYYKEGATDKVRRDTVYENLAVGAAFTASAPTVKGYKALVASADITVSTYSITRLMKVQTPVAVGEMMTPVSLAFSMGCYPV